MTRILTGIKPTGIPHWGNYFGTIKQTIELQNEANNDCFYFVADLHSFTTKIQPDVFAEYQRGVVLDWISLGLDPAVSTIYCQSDIRAHTELTWYLSCFCSMGVMNRAHAFKDMTDKGLEANIGLFTYPILMAADILLYDVDFVPVGQDQKQHVEIARDLAQKFNHHFESEIFKLPEPRIQSETNKIIGTDGAKMSKSYGNTIEIFADEKTLKKKIMSIKTESLELGDPMDPETCNVMAYHRLFGNPNVKKLEAQYRAGEVGFGESKKQLFEFVWDYFSKARAKREKLAADPAEVEHILQAGAQKANTIAEAKLSDVRGKFGLRRKHLA